MRVQGELIGLFCLIAQRTIRVLVAVLFLVLVHQTVPAQQNGNSNTSPSPSPTPIPVSAISSESDRTLGRIREIRTFLDALQVPPSIVPGLDGILPEIEEMLEARSSLGSGQTSLEAINSQEREWQSVKTRVTAWRTSLTERSTVLDERISEIRTLRDRWSEAVSTLKAGADQGSQTDQTSGNYDIVPPELIARAEEVLASLTELEKAASEKRSEFLAVGVRLSEVESRVDAELASIKRTRERELINIFSLDSPPIWKENWKDGLSNTGAAIRQTITRQTTELTNYARRSPQRFIAHGILLFGLIALLYWARRQIAPLVEDEPKLRRPAAFFQMPIAAGLVLSFIFVGVLYPQAPRLLTTLLGFAVIVPGILILRQIVERPINYLLYGLLGLYIADRIRELFQDLPLLSRLIFSVEMIAACAFLIWFYTSRRVEQNVEAGSYALFTRVRRFVPIAVIVLGIALGANVLGFVSLSYLIGNGVLRSAYAALLLYTFVQILISAVAFLLRVRPLSLLSLVRNNRLRVRQGITRGLNWIVVALWVYIVLGLFSIRDVVFGVIGDIIGFTVHIGEISFTIGDILLFAVMIWVAVLISRFVRFVLQEDVFPRMDLGAGVAFAISSVVHYLILISAFLMAIAAVGFEISRFAIVAGAVGLGLGFGLQNIINNFVSGLILLFERPVKVGDTVQIGQHMGSLKRIGLRASVVRKVDGSDVIVPNSKLISDEVINWTMMDDRRRVDIPVGVAYGTEPARVLQLLLDIPRGDGRILTEPAPRSLFVGLGDSSLDFELRFWTDDKNDWVALRSEMLSEVYKRLNEAGIEIPFPQQDLHIRSITNTVEEQMQIFGNARKKSDED